MADLHTFTLWARRKLTEETENLLLQIYGLEPSGEFLPEPRLPVLARMPEALETRKRLEKLFADERETGITPTEAYRKLMKEVAFTHLNRLVAFKLMEGRKLVRGVIDRYHDSNGFKVYLAEHDADLKLYDHGSMPQDDFSEGPSDRAYRHFLLWQCRELAKEVRVLFDADNLPSRLFPRPHALRELIDTLNGEDMKDAWTTGNEETIGWIYQYFNEPDLDRFRGQPDLQVPPHLVGPCTQNYTLRWVVRYLVQNSLGRLWMEIHPDSRLGERLDYLIPLSSNHPQAELRPVADITFLDPATGTMHFGLVAFDLFAEMYQEEIENHGRPGWPAMASAEKVEDIPGAILRNNLFGIDVDLRAVQLASIALYLRSKTLNPKTKLPEPNLACADVTYLTPKVLEGYLSEAGFGRPVYGRVLKAVFERLQDSIQTGSLLRLETEIRELVEQERIRAKKDATLFPDMERFGDALAGEEAFWDFLDVQIQQALDEIVRRYAQEGGSTFFSDQTARGFKLLELLMRRYTVIATNPPYLDSRDYNPALKRFINEHYRDATRNLYAAMIRRSLELLEPQGRLAMISGQSFMFISSFLKLREYCLNTVAIETLIQFDYGLFKARVDTAAFVLRLEPDQTNRLNSVGVYFRVSKEADAEAKRSAFEVALMRLKSGEADPHVYMYRQGDFAAIPGSPWIYQITRGLHSLFQKFDSLGSLFPAKEGINTGKNERFLRFWWEIGLAGDVAIKPWRRIAKGDRASRYVNRSQYVVVSDTKQMELEPGSAMRNPDCFLLPAITFLSNSSSSRFCAWETPEGHMFCSTGGRSLFPPTNHIVPLLGVLNSKVVNQILALLNPTITIKVGDLNRLPLPLSLTQELRDQSALALAIMSALSEGLETNYDFIAPPDWLCGLQIETEARAKLAVAEERIDREVYRLYGISDEDRNTIEQELSGPEVSEEEEVEGDEVTELCQTEDQVRLSKEELAARWLSYAVGIALGRFQPGIEGALGCGRFSSEMAAKLRQLAVADGLMVLEEGHPEDLAARIIDILRAMFNDADAEEIIHTVTAFDVPLRQSVQDYLLGAFFKEHVKRYRKRPVYWLLQSPERNYSVYLFHQRATENTLSLLQGRKYLGGRIHNLETDLEQAKDAENRTAGREKANWKRTARELAELLDDLRAFDQNITAANNFSITDRNGQPKIVRWQPEFDDGVLLNAAPLHELVPSWKRADPKLDLKKAWKDIEKGEYDWAKTAMRYWPQRVFKACQKNKSFAIAHGLA